jgi:pectinesterase
VAGVDQRRPLLRATRQVAAALAGGARLAIALAITLAGCTAASPPSIQDAEIARPQLDAAGAARFDRAQVLGLGGHGRAPVFDGWNPLADPVITGKTVPPLDYRVDAERADGVQVFATVQAAVNRALVDAQAGRHGRSRITIGIAPGRYIETVFVPAGPNPITLWGLGASAQAVRIEHRIDAGLPLARYVALLGPVYEAPGVPDAVRAIYRRCTRPDTTRTGCSTVLWVGNDGFRLRGVTVANRVPAGPPAEVRQAVALKIEGADRVHLEQVALLGHQDTLYLRTQGDDHIARSFVHRSLIEGDVDFIFGAGTAYFLDSEIRYVGQRRGLQHGWVGAPNTSLYVPYGLVFDRCRFTTDDAQARVALARQWFSGARCSPYGETAARCRIVDSGPATSERLPRPILESVGKMVVMRSWLGPHLQGTAPWAPWQQDRSAPNHRPAQVSHADFLRRLREAGQDPTALGYAPTQPAEPFLAEFMNLGPGAAPQALSPP